MALTSLAVDLADAWLAPGLTLASPGPAARRGSHVALAHPDAARVVGALAAAGVITDFRAPDRVRLGPAPVASRFVDVWDALDRMRRLSWLSTSAAGIRRLSRGSKAGGRPAAAGRGEHGLHHAAGQRHREVGAGAAVGPAPKGASPAGSATTISAPAGTVPVGRSRSRVAHR